MEFWYGNPRKREHLKDPALDGKMGEVCNELTWFRI
jgi:hypothetical protein